MILKKDLYCKKNKTTVLIKDTS